MAKSADPQTYSPPSSPDESQGGGGAKTPVEAGRLGVTNAKMLLKWATTLADIESLLLKPFELVCEDVVPTVIVDTLVITPTLVS